MKHKGTKIIRTERLLLRPFRIGDAEVMFGNWANDPEVTKYLTWTPHGSVEATRALLTLWEEESKKENVYHWAIEFEGELIGDISVEAVDDRCESGVIGYCTAKKCWGKGIMTEALGAVLKYCFEEVEFHRLSAMHSAENPAPGRVMEKCGLVYEGTQRDGFKLFSTGKRTDIICRAILRQDYLNK